MKCIYNIYIIYRVVEEGLLWVGGGKIYCGERRCDLQVLLVNRG